MSRQPKKNSRFPGLGTVQTKHLAPIVSFDDTLRRYGSNPFFNNSLGMIFRGDSRAYYDNAVHGVVMQSFPSRRNVDGGYVTGNRVRIVLGGYERAQRYVVPLRARSFKAPLLTGTVQKDKLTAVIPGDIPQDRSAGNVLNPWINNANIARAMSLYLTTCLQRFDNTYLYTKGLFYSIQATRIAQEELNVVYTPLPQLAGSGITDLDIMVAQATDIGDAISRGDLILMSDVDFDPTSELLMLCYLCLPGRRVAPNNPAHLASFGIMWDGIGVTILRRGGQAPVIPGAGPIDPEKMWRFIQKLATNRRERDYFAAGAYEASYLANCRLQPCKDGNRAQQNNNVRPDTGADGQLRIITGEDEVPIGYLQYAWHTPVTPTLETYGEVSYPVFKEYNFLHRLVQVTRDEDDKFLDDYICFGSCSPEERVLHGCVLSGMTSIFVTTALQSYNIVGQCIQDFAMRGPTPPLYYELAYTKGMSYNETGDSLDAPLIFILTVNLIDRHIGGVVPLTCMATRSWNYPALAWGFAGPFGITSPNLPPRIGNPLCLLSWLDLFPAEWGLVDGKTTCSFINETYVQGDINTSGWFASNGEPCYSEARCTNTPFSCIPYGAVAMNIIAQGLQRILPPGAPQFHYQEFFYDWTGRTNVNTVPANPNPPVWMPAYRIFEPCTILHWDWYNKRIYAPCLLERDSNVATKDALANQEFDNQVTCFGFRPALKVTNPASNPEEETLPSFKRRRGIDRGLKEKGAIDPPPAKVALIAPPEGNMPTSSVNTAPN